ncbi:hypothetical protein D3C71_1344620 [compost metagenome]
MPPLRPSLLIDQLLGAPVTAQPARSFTRSPLMIRFTPRPIAARRSDDTFVVAWAFAWSAATIASCSVVTEALVARPPLPAGMRASIVVMRCSCAVSAVARAVRSSAMKPWVTLLRSLPV